MLFRHTHMQKSNAASQPNSAKRSFSIFGGTTLIGNVLWNLCIHSNHHPMTAQNLCESPSQRPRIGRDNLQENPIDFMEKSWFQPAPGCG